MSYFNEKVQWDGLYVGRPRYVDLRTRDQFHQAEYIYGQPIVMYQGSWSDGELSADTHAGSGAGDVGPSRGSDWRGLETALREVGMAAWLRDWTNNEHVHSLSIGNDSLAPWAKVQVQAYFDGFDGLGPQARSGRDTGNRSYVHTTWEEYMSKLADEIAAELVKQAPAFGKGFAKGFLSADVIPSGKDEVNPKNLTQVPATFITGDHDLLVDIREALEKLAEPPKT